MSIWDGDPTTVFGNRNRFLKARSHPLGWAVRVTPGIPIAATLIYGSRYAVLVDTFMTVHQAKGLADWVEQSGKKLKTIYITHGHGDHWFGAGTLLQRFPAAEVVASPGTVKMMGSKASPEVLCDAWERAFPGQIPSDRVVANVLEYDVIDLEGEELRVVDLGHTDTDRTSCLHVASLGLVVAGNAAYNDVHLYLAESNTRKRQKWLAALDKIEALEPHAVVASHKRPGKEDTPCIIEETRQYIRDFDRLVASTTTAQELYDKMLELHPTRLNPELALWSCASAMKSSTESSILPAR